MKIGDLKNSTESSAPVVEEKEMKGMSFKTVNVQGTNSNVTERETVNFSKEMPEPTKGEFPGVTIKESIVDDIFGAGGPFEKYKQEKLAEAKKFIEEQKIEAELEGKKIVDGGVDLKPIIPAEDLEEADINGTTSNIVQFQQNNEMQQQKSDPNFVYKMQDDDLLD